MQSAIKHAKTHRNTADVFAERGGAGSTSSDESSAMSTSSTSITIKWASSQLAEILRKREEEEAMLRSRSPRSDDRDSKRKKGARRPEWTRPTVDQAPSRQRWNAPVDFSKPSPLKDRPRTGSGATSFHFAISKISKEASPTVNGKPVAGYNFGKDSPGANHELYIGRELATELQTGGFDAYLAREAAVEIDSAVLDREPGRVFDDELNEGLNDLDILTDRTGAPSIFSNISDDPFERAEFWKAVHRCERESRIQKILVDATKDPALIRRLVSDDQLPASFREVAALALGDADNGIDDPDERIRPRVWKASAEDCGKVLWHLNGYADYNARQSGISYKSGAGGTVQHRLVAELPHELTAAERARLVQQFCSHLATIEKGEDGKTRGLMYTAAIHAPDAHNDPRNFHLHVVFHDRPARLIEGMGVWDFEITEAFERKGVVRIKYPYRQRKLRMVRSSDQGTDPDISGRNFIPALRREFARITNETLERAGVGRRYDPRTYEAMGIERTPTDHLGTKAASLEAAGVETTVGSLNAQKIWRDAERDIARRTQQRKGAIEKRERELLELMADARREPEAAKPLASLQTAVGSWTRLAVDVAEDRELVEGFDLMEDKARSRAEKVRATCLRTLADIELGTARKADVKAKPKIEKRLADAGAWLMQIDIALSKGRADIEAAREKIEADEERAAVLSEEIEHLVKALQASVTAARTRAAQAVDQTRARPQQHLHEGHVEIVDPSTLEEPPLAPTSAASEKPVDRGERQNGQARTAAPGIEKAPTVPEGTKSTSPQRGALDPVPERSSQTSSVPAPSTPHTPEVTKSSPQTTKQPSEQANGNPQKQAERDQPEGTKSSLPERTTTDPAPKSLSQPSSAHTPVIPAAAEAASDRKMSPDKASTPPAKTEEQRPEIEQREPEQPAMFALPEQRIPPKTGSPEDQQKRLDELISRIQRENIFILPDANAPKALTVPSLSDEERELLAFPAHAKRTQARLEAIKKTQDLSIDRLTSWLKVHAADETKIKIRDRNIEPIDTPKAIFTLLEKYARHPMITPQLEQAMDNQLKIAKAVDWIKTEGRNPNLLKLSDGQGEVTEDRPEVSRMLVEVRMFPAVRAALRAEYERRTAQAEAMASDREAAAEQANQLQRNYIPTKNIIHPWVKEFVTGLNERREPEHMHELGRKITYNKQASEELYALGQRASVALERATNLRPDSKAPTWRNYRGLGY
ncbi:MobA/MobL family protein [Oscillatoria laete-virens NRMC-F 0139]|nr:MobA/MobL family protein [Oscillatoria laete-virens]MDL5054803.1 MobA/MobL family protein [Oscillatoria laete-virens NRMC-F 0139]